MQNNHRSAKYYNIAVNYPAFPASNSILTYLENDNLPSLKIGQLVKVPLGRRYEYGVVIEIDVQINLNEKSDIKYRKVSEVILPTMVLKKIDLELFLWTAKYYHYSLGQLIFDCLPSIPKIEKIVSNLALKSEKKTSKNKNLENTTSSKKASKAVSKLSGSVARFQGENQKLEFSLEKGQQEILEHILNEMKNKSMLRVLIHGVTGSGKTAIYINLIKEVLSQGKSVLYLLPEINLTPQFVEIFKKYLACEIFLYHSGVRDKDRVTFWSSPPHAPILVVGARSSIFLPIENLGLIILDEEHDYSYKQEDRCPYHTREVALKRASLLKIPVVMGTATPSLESFHYHLNFAGIHANANANANAGGVVSNSINTTYYSLKKRISAAKFPQVKLVDIRVPAEKISLVSKSKNSPSSAAGFLSLNPNWPLVSETINEIRNHLQQKGQVLILVNRLGFARYLQCAACGHQFECINCTTKLRYFQKRNLLSCQFCNFVMKIPEVCPQCNCLNIRRIGFGTEKVAEVLRQIFPQNIIDRFDRDEIKTVSQLNKKLQDFHAHKIDILVGTQMLSKGHNFEKVRLVVILGPDAQLNFPDFRASERTYQLLTQVAGRSGRFGGESTVIIQTLNPENDLFTHISEHTFDNFYHQELEIRKTGQFPPYIRMAAIYFTAKDQERTQKSAELAVKLLQELTNLHFKNSWILGPRPGIVEKRVGQYTWGLLIKGKDINELHKLLATFENNFVIPSNIQLKIDVDPYDFC